MAIDPALEYAPTTAAYRTNTTISKPANTADGDFLLATISLTSAITAPDGTWSVIYDDLISGRNRLAIYGKIASGEPTSWTWTHSYDYSAGIVKRFTGVHATTFQDCTKNVVTLNYDISDVVNTSITTASNGAAVCQIVGMYYGSGAFTSHSLTNRAVVDGLLSLDCDLQSSAGATGDKSVGHDIYEYAIGVLLALKPAAGGTVTGPFPTFRPDIA
jgi:hypothetical protein